MIALRKYQVEIIERARTRMAAGARSLLIQSACGSGKTLLTAHMLKMAAAKGVDSWFLCHRRELIAQASAAFSAVGLEHGLVGSGYKTNVWPKVQICAVQSLRRRAGYLRKPKLIVYDEAHHIGAATWAAIHTANPQAFHIGLSASPMRGDGKGLCDFFQEMISGPSIGDLIEQGYLSPYRVFAPSSVDLCDVKTKMGDYVKSDLAAAMDKPSITGSAVAHYKKLLNGQRVLVFCVSLEHSRRTVEQFKMAGIAAAHVDGETPEQERFDAMQKLRDGSLKVISNCDLFGEGVSIDSLGGVILLRPTRSVGLFVQQVGRALRVESGKSEAIILDHANCFSFHGFPELIEWSLEGRIRGAKKAGAGTGVRVCPGCFAACNSFAASCAYCGHIFEKQPRTVEEVEGELVEIDPKIARRQRMAEQSGARDLGGLIALGKARGYKNPVAWATHVHRSRVARGKA